MNVSEYKIRLATKHDLSLIENLQKQNHYLAVSDANKAKEGFVSVETDGAMLQRICEEIGIVIAEQDNQIVGYEFPLGLNHAKEISLLKPLMDRLHTITYEQKNLFDYAFVFEGQICIDVSHKGKGIAEALHKRFVQMLRGKYDLIVTEISNQNPRSLHVHTTKLGLKIIDEYAAEGKQWYILLQDIRK